mmetsp:Transcript_58771/g.161279  ORF Transcript_58771/g.161279 Transcript_58771/m.161279 type:complete len:90 (+) Transcript_58771:123-392(+)
MAFWGHSRLALVTGGVLRHTRSAPNLANMLSVPVVALVFADAALSRRSSAEVIRLVHFGAPPGRVDPSLQSCCLLSFTLSNASFAGESY